NGSGTNKSSEVNEMGKPNLAMLNQVDEGMGKTVVSFVYRNDGVNVTVKNGTTTSTYVIDPTKIVESKPSLGTKILNGMNEAGDFLITTPLPPLELGGLGIEGIAKGITKGIEVFSKADKAVVEGTKITEETLEIVTKEAGKPNQLHHFLSNKSSTFTELFEDVTKNYGLNLDDAWNKELLPHIGRHPDLYHMYMLENVNAIDKIAQGDKKLFLELFDGVKQEIIKNPDMLYKKYWTK
ncbi:MAG: AHH domain-containing protein, partial [Ruminiclostridium sp.]